MGSVAYNPPEGNIEVVYKWYILPIGGLYITYHLLREPETTIEDVPGRKEVCDRINGDEV